MSIGILIKKKVKGFYSFASFLSPEVSFGHGKGRSSIISSPNLPPVSLKSGSNFLSNLPACLPARKVFVGRKIQNSLYFTPALHCKPNGVQPLCKLQSNFEPRTLVWRSPSGAMTYRRNLSGAVPRSEDVDGGTLS